MTYPFPWVLEIHLYLRYIRLDRSDSQKGIFKANISKMTCTIVITSYFFQGLFK